MYGLPDSAILGTVKRLKGRRRGKGTDGWADLLMIVNAVRLFRARRRVEKARQQYFEKHGFYRQ